MYITFRLARVSDRERRVTSGQSAGLAAPIQPHFVTWCRLNFSPWWGKERQRRALALWCREDARTSLQLGSCVSPRAHHLSRRLWHIQLGHPQDVQPFLNWLVARSELNCSWIFSSHPSISMVFRLPDLLLQFKVESAESQRSSPELEAQSTIFSIAFCIVYIFENVITSTTTTTSWVAQGDCRLMKRQRSTDPRHNSSYYYNSYKPTPLLTYSRKPNNNKDKHHSHRHACTHHFFLRSSYDLA